MNVITQLTANKWPNDNKPDEIVIKTTNGYDVLVNKEDLNDLSAFTWTKVKSDGYAKCYREKMIDGKRYHFGFFDTIDSAKAIVLPRRQELINANH